MSHEDFKVLLISGVLTDLLTQQLQMHRLRYLSFHQVVNSSHKNFFRAHHQNEIFDAQQNIFSSQPQIEICFLYNVFQHNCNILCVIIKIFHFQKSYRMFARTAAATFSLTTLYGRRPSFHSKNI